jgi:hypothetical protein
LDRNLQRAEPSRMGTFARSALAETAGLVHVYATPVRSPDGRSWVAQAWADALPRGGWEGWFAFLPDDGGEPVWTDAETAQGRLTWVQYWASGIEPLYLEGALARALERPWTLRRKQDHMRDWLSARAESYERLSQALADEARRLRRFARRSAK